MTVDGAGCQAEVESAELTTGKTDQPKPDSTERFETIKLGIDANARFQYVAGR